MASNWLRGRQFVQMPSKRYIKKNVYIKNFFFGSFMNNDTKVNDNVM